MRILCTGDVHLGRRPSRIPIDQVPDQSPFSTKTMWERIVSLAIDESVDALLISGDLVDHDNRFFEALGPVEAGIERLKSAGIPIVAVTGNHDYDVLPAFAERHGDAFRVLGQHQKWERLTLRDEFGAPTLHIDGWSFALEHVHDDPLVSYRPSNAFDAPVIGLLHTDLDQSGSRYAPTSLANLHTMPVAAWLIGHVHVPRLHAKPGAPPVLYPGSPVPLDPGEQGQHGVWFLDITPNTPASFTFAPISPLQYLPIEVDITGSEGHHAAGNTIHRELSARAKALLDSDDATHLEYLLFRVTLTGRASIGAFGTSALENASELSSLGWSVERLFDQTRPAIDLDALAGQLSPPGVLADLLLDLDGDGLSVTTQQRVRDAIERSREELAKIDDDASSEPIDDRALIESTAWELLELLVAQQGVAS